MGDVAFWKVELDGKLAELKDSLEEITCQRDRVHQALAATKQPMAVTEKGRERRVVPLNHLSILFNCNFS